MKNIKNKVKNRNNEKVENRKEIRKTRIEIKMNNAKHRITTTASNLKKAGCKIENIYYNDKLIGILGYHSEEDKKAQINALTNILEATNGDIQETGRRLMDYANFIENANGDFSSNDREINYNNKTFIIRGKKLLSEKGKEIVNCEDVKENLSFESIKNILISRLRY